jgi:hypothetical protein
MRSKLVRTVTLAAAVCALSALATASASAALPEFKPSTGKYPVAFTFSGSASFSANSGKVNVACASLTGLGEIVNSQGVEVSATLHNCSSAGFVCGENIGGEYIIKTQPLEGKIGYYEESGVKSVGLELIKQKYNPLFPKFAKFAKFGCTGQPEVNLTGMIIGKLSPLNKSLTSFSLAYATNGTSQLPRKIENGYLGEAEEELSWNYGANQESSLWLLTGSETVSTASAVEIKA